MNQFLKTFSTFALISSLSVANSDPGSIQALRKIKVIKSEGRVLVWPPWTSQWKQVEEGMNLWESSLVQVGENSSVRFELTAKDGFLDLNADRVEVGINRPMVIRLNRNALRKIELGTFFVPSLPKSPEGKEDQPKLVSSLMQAWQRFTALVLPSAISPDWIKKAEQEAKQDTDFLFESQRIQLIVPQNEMIAMADRLPYELKIVWKKLKGIDTEYDVMVWGRESQVRSAIGRTKQDFFSYEINKEGTYFVQITSPDNRYQSLVHQVHVMLPLANRSQQIEKHEVSNDPVLVAPPAGLSYHVEQFPISVWFSWERAMALKPTPFTFVLADVSGKELFRKNTLFKKAVSVEFAKPGTFLWYVEAENTIDKNMITHRSEKRVIELNQYSRAQDLFQVFSGLLQSRRSATYFVDLD